MALILWSGGCDSTLLLSTLVDRCLDIDNEITEVRALAILHDQINARTEQKAARKNLLKVFKARGCNVRYTELTMKSRGNFCVEGGGCPQPVLWITNAMQYLGDEEDLYLGYIRGDDYWTYNTTINWAFDYLQKVLGKRGSIKAPLELMRKSDVIRELKRRRLYSKVWYCENPKNGRKCGKCEPCITHATALERIKYEDKKKCHDRSHAYVQ